VDLVGAGLDPAAALGASARVLRAAVGADATTIYVVDPRRDVLLRAVTTDPDAAHLLAKLAGGPPRSCRCCARCERRRTACCSCRTR